MCELVIKRHNFEVAKEELKKFSEQTPKNFEIDSVNYEDERFWGLISTTHQVTGDEFNYLAYQIQKHFSNVNDTQIKLIKEFGQVYNALEALDKDYLKQMESSIEDIKKTSLGIKEKNDEIKAVNKQLKETIKEFVIFKEELEGYRHLKDIDSMWQQITEENRTITEKLNSEIQNLFEKSERLKEELESSVKIEHIEDMQKKMKYSYLISGCSLALTILMMIFIFVKVI